MPKHENNALQKKSYKHSGLVVVECGRVSELCYRHRQKADLEKFSKVPFSKGSALHESFMPGVKLL